MELARRDDGLYDYWTQDESGNWTYHKVDYLTHTDIDNLPTVEDEWPEVIGD